MGEQYTHTHTMDEEASYSLKCRGNGVIGRALGLAGLIMLAYYCFVFTGTRCDPLNLEI